ncbi:MAG: polysaccharide deacetylase family protein [Thermodesulfobacteriota bacterium]
MIKRSLHKAISFEPVLGHMRGSRLDEKVVVLMYHEIAEDSDEIEAWTVVRKSDFIRQMEYLSVHFDMLSMEEALERMSPGHKDSQRPGALVTFDDGYSGNNRVLLPIVRSMNLPVTVFVATRAVKEGSLYWYDRIINALQGGVPITLDLKRLALGNYRINRYRGAENWREIERLLRDLKALEPQARAAAVEAILGELGPSKAKPCSLGPMTHEELAEISGCPLMTIGAHSHCHNILTQLSGEDIRESVETSRELLEEWTGCRMRYFSYPNGNFDDGVVDIIRGLGFECAVTTVSRPWSKEDPVFTIPRIGVGRYDSFESFKIKVSGG